MTYPRLPILLAGLIAAMSTVNALDVKSFNLTQMGTNKYDAAPAGQPPTPAQQAVDYIYSLGARQVVLTPEARMSTYNSNIVRPVTPLGPERAREAERYGRLIQYIKSKGMTVGLRPILLVERKSGIDGVYWHGNIQPTDPAAWFDSLRSYLNIYANIAKANNVDEFTVGAELYSMTVGLEDQWKSHEFGFPREWAGVIKNIREQLGSKTRIMYDMNYTDATANGDGTGPSGGEFERWRYRLADLKPDPAKPYTTTPENSEGWKSLVDLWQQIDVVGIDIYRSLLARNGSYPSNYDDLVATLEDRAGQFATDIDNKLNSIAIATGTKKRVIIKEIGFKSCTRCFTDPFMYDDPRLEVNLEHQAAAYQAFMNAFVAPGWDWMMGVSFWHVSIDPGDQGTGNPGFTPRGKAITEDVIRKGWN